MVLSSLLSRSSRAIYNPLVTSTRRVRVYGGRSLVARRIDTHSISAIPQVGMRRTFWDWRGSGRGDDKGDNEKGKGSDSDGGGRGRDGEGRSQDGTTHDQGAAGEQPTTANAASGSSPMLLGAGDQAPRPSRLIGLPITRRPLFPTTAYPYTITNQEVLQAVQKSNQGGRPYVAVFLRKERDWAAEGEAEGGDGAEARQETMQLAFPEVITSLDEIYHVGTLAQVHDLRPSAMPGEVQLLLVGHRRLSIRELVSLGPPLEVEVDHWSKGEFDADSDIIRAFCQEILSTVQEVVVLNPLLRDRLTFFSERSIDVYNPFKLADLAATISAGTPEQLQAVLAEPSAEGRLRLALDIISKEREVLRLQQDIKQQVEEKMNNQKRTYFLQEQLKSIKKELGLEKDDKESILNKFRERLQKIKEITKEAERAIEEELEKLSSLEKNSPEFNGTKSYLDWLTQLPWGHASVDNFDLKRAKDGLDEDHYGLDDIKDRILEFIAVGKLRGGVHGKILCFVGPPGVGKTSIGHSIAKALDREFYRFSVGGLRDVAEIKGHRRTYVGSMPGKLIQCLKVAGTNNPVILIDEIDKLGRGHDGDPASALLEVLDPSQNGAFLDNYLDVPVDLSNCLFICTANVLETIPGPLKDRMEVIRLSGYDLPEKVAISRQYLIPKARREHGMEKEDSVGDVDITEDAIESLARWYAREAGVRNLANLINKIHRKLALEMVREEQEAEALAAGEPSTEGDGTSEGDATAGGQEAGKDEGGAGGEVPSGQQTSQSTVEDPRSTPRTFTVSAENLEKYVGKPIFTSDRLYEGQTPPGVVMGLAWTAMGGSSLYVEAAAIRSPHNAAEPSSVAQDKEGRGEREPGDGALSGSARLRTTGQLGDVMNESAQIAYSVAREYLSRVRPDRASFFGRVGEVHMHVPEGATPKDGPSAGVTMVTSLLSLASGTSVREDLAMTGELSLTGKVLPVGGIKEKTIAARRANCHFLVFPYGNKRDFEELPDYLKEGLEVHFAKEYSDVYDVAFGNAAGKTEGDGARGVSPVPPTQ